MRHFINLTSFVINKSHIVQIIKKPNKYYIYMTNNNLSGSILFSSGSISTNENIIEICEKNNRQDYNIIKRLIEQTDAPDF
jgi:hypothetical protein